MSPRALRSYRPAAFIVHLLLLFIAGPNFFKIVSASSWTYEEGNNGPDEWPGMCQGGARQSPINLDPSTAFPGHFEPLVLINFDSKLYSNITNNGHTVMLELEQPCKVMIAAGGLPGVYHFNQAHFHWQSEHTLRGKRWPLEMHLVHYDRKFPNLNEAVKYSQGLSVLAVLFYESKTPNPAFETILEAISKMNYEEGSNKPSQPIGLQDLLPSELNRFYRYAGSLTTPNCDESVVWTVFTQLVPVGELQIQEFSKVLSHHQPLLANYRPLQKINNRRIFLQHPPDDDDDEISASSLGTHHSWLLVLLLGLGVTKFYPC